VKDIEKLKAFEHPFFYAVDVNSRVEIEEGVKDIEAIKELAEGLLAK